MENPCTPPNDCACLNGYATTYLASRIVNLAFRDAYQLAANNDEDSYWEIMLLIYQYSCETMMKSGGPERLVLTDAEKADLQEAASEFQRQQVEKLLNSRGL